MIDFQILWKKNISVRPWRKVYPTRSWTVRSWSTWIELNIWTMLIKHCQILVDATSHRGRLLTYLLPVTAVALLLNVPKVIFPCLDCLSFSSSMYQGYLSFPMFGFPSVFLLNLPFIGHHPKCVLIFWVSASMYQRFSNTFCSSSDMRLVFFRFFLDLPKIISPNVLIAFHWSCAQFLEARVASTEEGNLYVDITELRMDQVSQNPSSIYVLTYPSFII